MQPASACPWCIALKGPRRRERFSRLMRSISHREGHCARSGVSPLRLPDCAEGVPHQRLGAERCRRRVRWCPRARAELVDEFIMEPSDNPPAASRVEEIDIKEVPLEDFDSFEIRFSDDDAVEETTLVSPELATCEDCACASCLSTPTIAATGIRSSTARTAGHASPSSTTCPMTGWPRPWRPSPCARSAPPSTPIRSTAASTPSPMPALNVALR